MNNYVWILFSFLSLFSLVANYLLNKGLSINFSPLLSIAVTGIAQFFIAGFLFLFSNEKISEFTHSNLIMAVLVAVCVIGIDFGMIAAFRYGGNTILVTLIVSMATVVMAPISFLFFKESLSLPQLIGVLLSIISISLVVLFPAK